jgi:hypothetical protein
MLAGSSGSRQRRGASDRQSAESGSYKVTAIHSPTSCLAQDFLFGLSGSAFTSGNFAFG